MNNYQKKITILSDQLFGLVTWSDESGEKEIPIPALIDKDEKDGLLRDFLQNVKAELQTGDKSIAQQILSLFAEYRQIRTESRKVKIKKPAGEKVKLITQMVGWDREKEKRLTWLQAQDRTRKGRAVYLVFEDAKSVFYRLSDMSHSSIYLYDGGSKGQQRTVCLSIEQAGMNRDGEGNFGGQKIYLAKREDE